VGKLKKNLPVKLFSGFIFKEEDILRRAESLLERKFGRIDFKSPVFPFSHTHYYEKEFGKGLKRKFISFKKLIRPEGLPKIKVATNKVEQKLSRAGLRLINIDPGYLDTAKVVLATTKDYRHRIYLNKGIYAEIALFYENKDFKTWEWTYLDYKTADYIAVFSRIREIYVAQIKNKCTPPI